MRARLITCLAIFSLMGLSNAVVPLLPLYSQGSSLQGAIYAAYFFGAFAITLPAGMLADRFGRGAIMRSGLFITIPGGLLLGVSLDPTVVIAARLLEGFGAGLFVAAAMAYINTLPDHKVMSGYYFASLNAGLVLGLAVSGLLAVHVAAASGIVLFTGACFSAAVLSLAVPEPSRVQGPDPAAALSDLIRTCRRFWVSAIVLIGITGIVISLYPSFSPAPADIDSVWIAGMSLSTILASLIVSRIQLEPVKTIRTGGVLMAAGVIVIPWSPVGFIVVGAAAGIVMVAQMDFLSRSGGHQGTAMGLFSTTSYLGMSLLPFLAGILADRTGYTATFLVVAGTALAAAFLIGKFPREQNPVGHIMGQRR